MVVCALPGADHFSRIVHHDVALCRHNDKNEMPDSGCCLDYRQSQSFRGQAVLKELVPLGDGVIVAVSNVRGDRPTIPKILAIARLCVGIIDMLTLCLTRFSNSKVSSLRSMRLFSVGFDLQSEG